MQEVADESVILALIKCLTDEYSDIRRDAAIALGNIGNPDVLNALQQTLDDPDADVRIFSQKAIDKIREAQGVAS